MFVLTFAFHGMNKSVSFPVLATTFSEAEKIADDIMKSSKWQIGGKGHLSVGQACLISIEKTSVDKL